jgi:hypothetical protein
VNGVDPWGLKKESWWQKGLKAVANAAGAVAEAPGKILGAAWRAMSRTKMQPGTPTLRRAHIDREFDDDPEVYASRRGLRQAGAETKQFIRDQTDQIAGQLFFAGVGAASAGSRCANGARALQAGARLPRHHIFPQALQGVFAGHGIDIHKYTIELPVEIHKAIHQGAGGGRWNKAWHDFFAANPGAGREEIYRQAGKMLHDFGIDGRPLIPYR